MATEHAPLDPLRVELGGTTLIEASAGTGKTYTITTLVLRLLLERELDVKQLLVVTFTRAATAELRDRVRRRLAEMIDAIDAHAGGRAVQEPTLAALARARAGQGERDRERLVRALRDFDQAPILTIHAFCQRTLGEEALESRTPFELEFLEDESTLVQEVAQDYWARIAYPASLPLLARLDAGGVDPASLEQLASRVVREPDMPVLPARVEAPPAPDAAPLLSARARAAELWHAHRAEVLELLDPELSLNKNSYKREIIQRQWAPQLDRLAHWESVPDFAEKLTPAVLARRTRKGCRTPRHAFFDAIGELHRLDVERRAALDRRVLQVKRELVDFAREQVARRKRQAGVQSFGDLLTALDGALRAPTGAALAERIRARYRAALIDEFQDTDPVQYRIFGRIFGEAGLPLFQIGDPKQAIYAFRGADVYTYVEAARRAGERVYTLDRSYRSDPALLRAINTLFAARRPFLQEEIGYVDLSPREGASERLEPPPGPQDVAGRAALQLLFARRTDDNRSGKGGSGGAILAEWANHALPRRVAGEIVELLESGTRIDGEPIAPRHIAVLCRTNRQAERVQQALMELQVPTVREGDSSVFDTTTAEELERVLSAALQPADGRKALAALATALLGVPGEALYRMHSGEDEAGQGGDGLELWMERFAAWGRLWHERGFVHAFHRLIDDAEVQQRLLVRPDGQRRLTDLLHLGELLHTAASAQHLGPLSLLVWLTQMRQDRDARGALVGESAQVRLEHDDHAVMLTTIHRSKGLEYPIVFCPYLHAEPMQDRGAVRFHDGQDGHAIKLDLGSDELELHALQARKEAMAEALRLLYVGLTRARHRCYVVWGRFHRSGGSPLGHLLHQGDLADDALFGGVERRLAKLDDAAMLDELQALCSGTGGALAVRELRGVASSRYSRPGPSRGDLEARRSRRQLPPWLRSASFSRIVAERSDAVSAPAEEGLDHDEAPEVPELPALAVPDEAPVTLHDFPAGARPGTSIHSVFEHIDFQRADPDELPSQARHWLDRHGIASGPRLAALSDALVRGIGEVLTTPLQGAHGAFTLADVPRGARLDELEFLLPAGREGRPVDAAGLARVFERHGAPGAAPDYHARLAELELAGLSGHLKGFVDLIVRHDGRFYLLDYKSNWLGSRPSDYSADAMARAMLEHDYYLQYHLYVVALDRYLRARLGDYDYGRDFGGVFYLFVRGMAPGHAPGTGVFHDRPAPALIAELSQLLGGAP